MSVISAYTRNPHALFKTFDSEVLDNIRTKRSKTRIFCYKNALLNHSLGPFPEFFRIHEAAIDWYTCNIKVFLNHHDAMNNITAFDGFFYIPCEPRKAEDYVLEVYYFLSRGHSIFHPKCTCHFSNEHDRIVELGPLVSVNFEARNNKVCLLHGKGSRQTVQKVELELGIKDIKSGKVYVNEHITTFTLLQTLTSLGGFLHYMENGIGYIESRECHVPRVIKNTDDILYAAKTLAPGPFLLKRNMPEYIFEVDLLKMQDEGKIRMVFNEMESICIFYCNPLMEYPKVDEKLRTLWHSCAVRQSAGLSLKVHGRELDALLINAGIQPMRIMNSSIPGFNF